MKKNTLSIVAYMLLSVFFIVGCQQKEKESDETIIKYSSLKDKKKEKNKSDTHKKGIEHIADYQKQIRKGIDEEKSTYKKGYLIEEFNKAKQNLLARNRARTINAVFTERGPNNVPGRSRGIAIDPNDLDRWFVGTVGGGVWLTEDGGTTWATLTDFEIPNLATSTIVISQTNSDILYVGTGEPFGNIGAIGGSGVFKTTDGGTTWQHLIATTSLGGVGRIIINPADDSNVIMGTSSGIYRTTDGGTTWSQTYNSPIINNRVSPIQDLDADPTDFNIQYGSVRDLGLVKSTDAGITWSVVFNTADFNANHSRFETSISPADPNTVFLSVYTASGGATVGVNTDFYVSRDKGTTFTNLTTTDTNANLLTGQGWYDNVIMAHPYDANIFYVGGVAVFKVTVSGTTFTSTSIASGYDSSQINSGVHVDQHGLFSILGTSNEFRILLANDGGVYSTTMKEDSGATEGDWSGGAVGKNSTQFYGAAKQNGFDNYLAGAQDNGCWISLDNNSTEDKSYVPVFGGDGFEVIWHYDNPRDFIVSSQGNRIGRYVDFSFAGQVSLPGGAIFYTKVANADNNPDVVFAVSGNGVWRSADFAANWNLIPISANFTPGAASALNVKVSVADPNVVWAGAAMTESGAYVLQVSQDNGQSFVGAGAYNNPNDAHNLYISGLATSPIERNRAYALFSSQGRPKILKTEDLGATWSDITGFETGTNTGFPDVAVHSVLEMPFDKDIIWAGTDIGVFQTEDGGTSWNMVTDFPAVAVYDMKIVNDQVVIATYGRGVWSATIAELSTYTLPTYLAFAEVSTQQKEIGSLKTIVSYKVPTDDVSSVKIFIDGTEQAEITQDFSAGVSYMYETNDVAEGYHQLGVQVFDDTNNVQTPINNQEFLVIDFNNPSSSIEITEFEASDVFTYRSDFVIDNLRGDVSGVVLNNSDHPYNNSKTYSVALKDPLTISESNKTFTYEDFAIVEPYTDNLNDLTMFYDFVIIEASSDLATWKTLDKYDSRRFSEWLAEYNNGANVMISDALFKEQNIVLTDEGFNIGDTVVFRFSLVSDPVANSYGWAIKSINAGATASISEVIKENKAFTVYPTISNGNFTLYAKNTLGKTEMNIFDITGKKVFQSSLDFTTDEKQDVSVNLNAGVYIVNLIDENNQKSSNKIIIE
ncbi:MAG: T9SS type A sorting domain-containing protein [Polaribacter sp.]